MEPIKRKPGRPKKSSKDFDVVGADPVLRDEEGYSPADEVVDRLTKEQIHAALSSENKNFIDAGVRLRVDEEHWYLEKDFFVNQKRGMPKKKCLRNSGSLQMPVKHVIDAANHLYSQVEAVEQILAQRNPKGAKLNYTGMGEIIGKDGEVIEAA